MVKVRTNIDFNKAERLQAISDVLDSKEVDKLIKLTLRQETNRIVDYAYEHHSMTYRDVTGSLSRAITSFRLTKIRGGWRQSVGISPKIVDESGVSAVKKFKWLTEGTHGPIRPVLAKYLLFPAIRPHFPGNWTKKGEPRGGYWRLSQVSGIDPRPNFLENAVKRTKAVRDANFDKLAKELIRKVENT